MSVNSSERIRRVTRNDVAKRANVSPAVVSYVINNSKFVSPEKTEAVKKAIAELQYRPNMQARSLKTQKTMQIAFVCDNLLNYWLEEAETILFEKGYYVSHCYSRDSEEFIQQIVARQFDAVFMMSNLFSTAQLNMLADAGIPVVLYKTRNYGAFHPGIATVVPDYSDGVVKSVNYLAMKGHERIALIPPIRYKMQDLAHAGFRIRAYLNAMRQNGLPIREDLVCMDTRSVETITKNVLNMLLSGSRATRPTAFIVCNDHLAIQLMKEIKQLGLRIPEDVAIIGADNTFLADLVSPSLTSIEFSKQEFAQKMANALLALIQGEQPEDEYIPVSLVVRASA